LREPYEASPIATEKFIDVNSKNASHGIVSCSQWSYWNSEDDECQSPEVDYDRYSTISEPARCRSNAAFFRRKERIDNLRFNLAPFGYEAAVHGRSKVQHGLKPFPSKKTLSFAAVSDKVSSTGPESGVSFTNVRMCGGSSHPIWDSAIAEEDGLCYDSDPGFVMPNRKDEMLQMASPTPKKVKPQLSSTSFDEEMSVS
jgi:hypothetical protein